MRFPPNGPLSQDRRPQLVVLGKAGPVRSPVRATPSGHINAVRVARKTFRFCPDPPLRAGEHAEIPVLVWCQFWCSLAQRTALRGLLDLAGFQQLTFSAGAVQGIPHGL